MYGVITGFDEPQKIITGLQLKQQGIIDTQTLQENMDGLDNITKIQNRINSERAETVLFESLMAQAAQGNPKATMAAIEIRKNPQTCQIYWTSFILLRKTYEEKQELIRGLNRFKQGPPPGLAQVLAQAAAQGGENAG